jgi:hypothetical protein
MVEQAGIRPVSEVLPGWTRPCDTVRAKLRAHITLLLCLAMTCYNISGHEMRTISLSRNPGLPIIDDIVEPDRRRRGTRPSYATGCPGPSHIERDSKIG